jgi:hypothetical protein
VKCKGLTISEDRQPFLFISSGAKRDKFAAPLSGNDFRPESSQLKPRELSAWFDDKKIKRRALHSEIIAAPVFDGLLDFL